MTAGMAPDPGGSVLTPVLLRQPLAATSPAPEVVARWEALLGEAHRALDDAGVPADGRRACSAWFHRSRPTDSTWSQMSPGVVTQTCPASRARATCCKARRRCRRR